MRKTKFRLAALLLAVVLLLCACDLAPSAPTQPAGPTDSTSPTEREPEPTGVAFAHRDDNGDEQCDDCGIDVIVELDFYSFNDLHGVFNDTVDNPGLDEMTTFFKNAYADDASHEILLSAGDMWQGSVESSSNKGQLMTQWMNHMGFVAMTLGNHEYDWGSAYIAQNAELAEFPFLGINVTDTSVPQPYCQSSVVVERGGVKIGIIGAIGDVLSSISGEFTDGLSFAVRSELTDLVKAEATRLRQQEGCHLIVYSLHAGGESTSYQPQNHMGSMGYYNMALSEGYVDLVFEGHSHHAYILRDKHGVYHLQAGGYNSGISFVNVCYDLVTNTYEIQDLQILGENTFADPTLADDPIIDQLYSQYFPAEDPYTTALGRNDVLRSSNDIGHTVARLYLEKGREIWGDQYDVVLGGGFIKTRTPYDLSAGAVTYSQLFSLLPFDNSLVLCQVTGKELREKFLNSSSYFIACDEGLRQSIDDSAFYYVVTDTYTSFYKYNMLTEIDRLENYYARDLLRDFIVAGGWGGQVETVSIAQANAIGASLGENASTPVAYQITGVVTEVENTTYGNLYIADEQGNTFYIYGLYDATGRIRYDAMENPPQVGDSITVIGAITKYVGYYGEIIEMKSATLQ